MKRPKMLITLLVLLAFIILFFSLFIPVSSGTVVETCCPKRTVMNTTTTDPEMLRQFWLTVGAGFSCLAAAVALFIRRPTLALVITVAGAGAAAFSILRWFGAALLLGVAAWIWTLVADRREERRTGVAGGSRQPI